MPTNGVPESILGVCDYLALRDTYAPADVAAKLLLRLAADVGLEALPIAQIEERFSEKFSVAMPRATIEDALETLQSEGHVVKDGDFASFTHSAIATAKSRLDEVQELEKTVRSDWWKRSQDQYACLDEELLWTCLGDFLTAYFKLNGLRTLDLLSPSSIDGNPSFDAVLSAAASKYSLDEEKPALEKAVRDFFKYAESDGRYAEFVSGIASGAFCFLASEAPPEVAASLKRGLGKLTLYIDTNFLIAVVGLNYQNQQIIAREVVDVIAQHQLPIRLRFLPVTEHEFQVLISSAKGSLSQSTWSAQLARAASQHIGINGIHHSYFQRRSETLISVEDFFLRFEDLRGLLVGIGGIQIDPTGNNEPPDRFEIEADFREFVAQVKPEGRPVDAIAHDAYLLAWVRNRRSGERSLLNAECIVLTFDSLLSRFDCLSSRKEKLMPSVVMPHQLLQLLGPFIPRTEDFDRAFATAIFSPEFRSIDLPPGIAYAKMLSLLSAVDGLQEGQATKLLANRLLVKQIGNSKSDQEAIQLLEVAAIEMNRELAVKNLDLERQLDAVRGKEKKISEDVEKQMSVVEALETRVRVMEAEKEKSEASSVELLSKAQGEIAAKKHELTEKDKQLRATTKESLILRRSLAVAGLLLFAGIAMWVLQSNGKASNWKSFVGAWACAIGTGGAIAWPKKWQFWVGTFVVGGLFFLLSVIPST